MRVDGHIVSWWCYLLTSILDYLVFKGLSPFFKNHLFVFVYKSDKNVDRQTDWGLGGAPVVFAWDCISEC